MNGPNAEHEALFHIELQHHHIIRTFGLVKNDRPLIMLLQERASHDDLQTLLQKIDFQPSAAVLKAIFLQIIDAMIYLTKQGIVHSDLRCDNILVFEMNPSEPQRNLVKLTGFSLARRKNSDDIEYKLADTLVRFSAPEILENPDGANYSELSDVYSMGVLMWVAFAKGEIPYGRRTSDHVIRQKILSSEKLSRPTECSEELWAAIDACWTREIKIRSNFEYLQDHLLSIDVR